MNIVTQETTPGTDDLQIFFRSWKPHARPHAAIMIVPGFNAHSGYYDWVGEELASAGYSVYAIDLRGRGSSDGERFFVESFDDYVYDVEAITSIIRRREGSIPLFLLGHSAGGVVACLYALKRQNELAGLISESFAHELPAPDFVLAVFRGLSHIAPHAHILHLPNERFSRNPDFVATMDADPLIKDETQPTQTMAAMVRADERLKNDFALITLPVLILHGTADQNTKPSGSQHFYENVGSADKTLQLYEGGYHDLLNDIDREIVMSDIKRWLNDHLDR